MFGFFRNRPPQEPPDELEADLILSGPAASAFMRQQMDAQADLHRQAHDANARVMALNCGMALANGDPDRALSAARRFHAFLTGKPEAAAEIVPLRRE